MVNRGTQMKKLLFVLSVLLSFTAYSAGNSQVKLSKCVIEDYNNAISKDVKEILGQLGYSFSDSQADSNLNLYLEESCGQDAGFAVCMVSIVGNIDGHEVYTNSSWIESDTNPFQLLYRVALNKLNKSHIKNFESCETILNRSAQ